MQIIQAKNCEYRSEIISLYIEAFATGKSSQFIDLEELNKYLELISKKGNVLVAFDNQLVLGALLSCPLSLDNLLPEKISTNFSIKKCVYVAEMMVTENARGQGIGKFLLSDFFETVDRLVYEDAFIRVWDQNIAAISLYKKMGFEPIADIEQIKKRVNGIDTFVMKKIYLHKKIN
jgi:ribosomal protein S18 acetylase RimI-like enzyme